MTPRELEFGAVKIQWDGRFNWPIAINHTKLNGDKFLITQCPITYKIGELQKSVWADYLFDGASIPWYIRWVPGYNKIGWHLFASCIHDFSCDYPREIPRPIGDGIFTTLLLELAANGSRSHRKKRKCQAWSMARAVGLFTLMQAWRGKEIIGHTGKTRRI